MIEGWEEVLRYVLFRWRCYLLRDVTPHVERVSQELVVYLSGVIFALVLAAQTLLIVPWLRVFVAGQASWEAAVPL